MIKLYYDNKKALDEIENLIQQKRGNKIFINKENNTGIFIGRIRK